MEYISFTISHAISFTIKFLIRHFKESVSIKKLANNNFSYSILRESKFCSTCINSSKLPSYRNQSIDLLYKSKSLLISLFQCFSKSNSKINQNVNLMSLLLTWNNIEMFLLLTFRGVFRTQSNVWDRNLCEIVEGYQSFSIFGKSSIVYVWLGSECTSDFGSWFCYWNWLKLISFIVKFASHVS